MIKIKYIAAGLFLITLVGLPVILSLTRNSQEIRSRAAASSTVYFSPVASSSSPLVANIGDKVIFDIMLNPGSNLPSFVKLEIQFDPDKLKATPTSFLANQADFPTILEGPHLNNGNISLSLSIGSDTTKAIQSTTKVGTLTLTALSPTGNTPTVISFGNKTMALSIASSDYNNENILSSMIPAYVQIPGSITPSITLTPSAIVNITAFLHGIGSSGDNTNPNESRLSNKSPQHLQRPATLFIYGSQNQFVSSKSGILNYDPANGNFTGQINLDNSVTQGIYTLKLQTPVHLIRLIPGIHTLTTTQTNTLPAVTFITGDIYQDNSLNILDYNILINCYSDLQPPKSCTDPNNTLSDLNDDNSVNQVDYNLFLREISVQSGY